MATEALTLRRIAVGLDPAALKNACALAVLGETEAGIWVPLHLREWIPTPGAPLDLRLTVLPDAAADVLALVGSTPCCGAVRVKERTLLCTGATAWATDPHASAEVQIVSAEQGVAYVQATSDAREHWRHVAAVLARRQLALAPTGLTRKRGPAWPDAEALAELRRQLARVRREYVADGWRVTIPEVGGLHGDLAVAVARALWLAQAADHHEHDDSPRQRIALSEGMAMAEF